MKYRAGRLGEEIRRVISQLLLRELKDPRLSGMVSISGVDVTEDCSYATVYFTVLDGGLEDGSEEHHRKKEEVLLAFQSAKGLIRREIARQIKLRHAPELLFKADTSMEYGRRMSRLIDSLDIPAEPEEQTEAEGEEHEDGEAGDR
ncbi:MAG: 30S ribosome-binding factor RbfA [Bacillota bacterium]|nr:30S ribosome-binding factor RbfA [Bacillota bacterium]